MMLVAAWMRTVWTLPFFFSHVSWVLSNLMTESSCCFQKEMWEKLRTWILYNELYNFRQVITYLSAPTVSSWWSQSVTLVAWCMWWSDTLWATLTRSQLHSVSCCLSIQIVVVEVCLQLHRYVITYRQLPLLMRELVLYEKKFSLFLSVLLLWR
jgi:hypothetical protein